MPTTEYLGAQRRHALTGQNHDPAGHRHGTSSRWRSNFRTGLRSGSSGVLDGIDLCRLDICGELVLASHALAHRRVLNISASAGGRVGAAAGTLVKPPLTMSSLSSRRVRMIVSATARCFRYPASGGLAARLRTFAKGVCRLADRSRRTVGSGAGAEIETSFCRWRVCLKDIAPFGAISTRLQKDYAARIARRPCSEPFDPPRLNCARSWLRAAASRARPWLAAVDCSTIAAFFCVPWSITFTAVLIS